MRIIYNKIIPFKGYKAINLFGFVFSRDILTEIDKNHEAIHTYQMKKVGYVKFYIIYLYEYIKNLIKYRNNKLAYKNISFEIEAYNNQNNLNYVDKKLSQLL